MHNREVTVTARPGFVRVATMEQDELVIRMFEAMVELKRPPSDDAAKVRGWLALHHPVEHDRVTRMASAALGYFEDCLTNSTDEAKP